MMLKRITTGIILSAALFGCVLIARLTVFAQAPLDMQKVGQEGVVKPIKEAQAEEMGELARGTGGAAPSESSPAAPEQGPATMELEGLDEDLLRQAIASVEGLEMFADSASRIVRDYIRKIKVADVMGATPVPGKEPWKSEKSEIRYSPFDTTIGPPPPPPPKMLPAAPFLPPIKPTHATPVKEILERIVNLRMTSKSGDEYMALVDIAGQNLTLRVGDVLDPERKVIPPEIPDIEVTEISIDGLYFSAGNERVYIPFAITPAGTEEESFYIEVTR